VTEGVSIGGSDVSPNVEHRLLRPLADDPAAPLIRGGVVGLGRERTVGWGSRWMRNVCGYGWVCQVQHVVVPSTRRRDASRADSFAALVGGEHRVIIGSGTGLPAAVRGISRWRIVRSTLDLVLVPQDVRAGSPVMGVPAISVRGLWLLLGTLTPAVSILVTAGLWPLWQHDRLLAAITTFLAVSFFVIGVVLCAERGQGGPALAMVACTALLVLSWANEWGGGPLPLASTVLGPAYLVAAGWALFRYPDRSLAAGDRWMFRLMLVWLLGTPWLVVATSLPEWHDFPADTWWPSPWPDHALTQTVQGLLAVGTVGFVVLYVYRWVFTVRSAGPAVRRQKIPIAVAAICAATFALIPAIGGAVEAPDPVLDVLDSIAAVAFLAVPVAFLIAVLKRQLARTALTDLLVRIGRSSGTAETVDALRHALGDPDLRLLAWSGDAHSYLDESGQPTTVPGSDADWLTIPISTTDGDPLAVVIAEAAGHHDTDLVEAAVQAVSLNLQNTLLLERVRAQYSSLAAASGRVMRAADDERRRLQQDLHDGAQTHFLALGPLIGALEATTPDAETAAALGQIRNHLEYALGELRQLGRGLRPSALRLGLAAGVKDTLRHFPIVVDIDLPDGRLPETTEVTAYFAIVEATTNITRHADANHAAITGRVADGWLTVTIADDGRGGACAGSGAGLTGITDRVTALGGRVWIDSPGGTGTFIELEIPCG